MASLANKSLQFELGALMSQTFSCTEELLQALPQPIAIVGNGVPAGAMGAAIDHHASVIRLNNYRLDGFEAVGRGGDHRQLGLPLDQLLERAQERRIVVGEHRVV